jgi:hypothetical protein
VTETSATGRTDADGAADASDVGGQPSTGLFLAGLLAGAGIIHLVMVPAHVGAGSWIDPVAFAVVGWVQIALAVALVLGRGGRSVYGAVVVTNLAVLGLWVASRTVGLPVGSHVGVVEPVGTVDGVCAALQVAAVVVAAALLVAPDRLRLGVLGPSLAAVAVLGMTTVALVTPDDQTAGHTHGAHDHGVVTDTHAADMVAIDKQRCDLGFNPRSYWDDAPRMGVDTYAGGSMAPHVAPTLQDQVTAAEPFDGRGSVGLDQLISATSEASAGEVAAANLVNRLSAANDADYEAWVHWMRTTALAGSTATSAGHSHGGTTAPAASATGTANATAPDDNHGHGGHAGPQPWKAMVDPQQCVQLSKELAVARDTALKFPTAADAVAAGYTKVTPYVPGIAAHYMKFDLVDNEFQVDQPEMVLYDGDGPDAHVVGLSYYLLLKGESEPSQGFTGANDHFHRHVGLCTQPGGGVIGDSTTTAEQCKARGGVKADGSIGWMSHAWVVPGCESPWGVFSGASPTLDLPLATVSGQNDGACSASGVRHRYDLRPGGKQPSGTGESAGGD